ncbi:MAG: MFS transporter [Polyangiales bacterium]
MSAGAAETPIARLSRAFWMLCTMEMWERLAYYGVRVVAPIYIMQADEPGGLHFSASDKATIYAYWFVVQSILPTFTGGLADRYGYKNTLAFSITLKVLGYVLMATQRSFWGFFLGTMVLAAGTAQFKPGIQGSIAQHLDEKSGSKGWGIFYWLVNVGAVIGPPFAGWLHGFGWDVVFYGCAAIVSLNYLMLFTYEEKRHEKKDLRSPAKVLVDTLRDFLDWRLLTFLLLMSGFWLMMYQLWDLHPNFLTDWVYSGAIADTIPMPDAWVETKNGIVQVKQENLLNLNAALIVLFVIPVSALVAKMRTLSAMLGGMVVATIGIVVSGVTQIGWVFLLGVVFFSFGEMLTGPKKNQYLAAIAPADKRGQYLGYVNIPAGLGGYVGSMLAGHLYGNYGEKATLALRYLAENTTYLSSRGASWNGEVDTLEKAFEPFEISRSNAFDTLMVELQKSGSEATDLLWNTYQPYQVWYAFAAIGVVSILGLFLFNRAAKRWHDLNK